MADGPEQKANDEHTGDANRSSSALIDLTAQSPASDSEPASKPVVPVVAGSRVRPDGSDDGYGPSSPSSTLEAVRAHKRARTSLRLSASRIAAMSGFNPHADLPRLLLDLIYQGRAGQALLRHDAALLGMSIVSEEERLAGLAAKAGAEATEALRRVMDVKEGIVSLGSTSDASKVKERGMALARSSKHLSAGEKRRLAEGMRSGVDTGFGTRHEEEALDVYERRYGCAVRGRNEETMVWDFEKRGDDASGGVATVVPVREARPLPPRRDPAVAVAADGNGASKPDAGSARKGNDDGDIGRKRRCPDEAANTGASPSTDAATAQQATCTPKEDGGPCDDRTPKATRPYFSILGKIDGIRDELCFGHDNADVVRRESDGGGGDDNGDDDGWHLRPIVVECKHRMSRAYDPPPLYDQIQAAVYCLMYNTEEAELVQVVRRPRAVEKKFRRNDEKGEGKDKTAPKQAEQEQGGIREEACASVEQVKNTNDSLPMTTQDGKDDVKQKADSSKIVSMKVQEDGVESEEKMEQQQEQDAASGVDVDVSKPIEAKGNIPAINDVALAETELDITVSRVSLKDPYTQHRTNWTEVILPRLRSFVDAVYTIRSDDDRRYRLLDVSAKEEEDAQRKAWQILFAECPWLASDCDTAYRHVSS